jgi:hypothetical protein
MKIIKNLLLYIKMIFFWNNKISHYFLNILKKILKYLFIYCLYLLFFLIFRFIKYFFFKLLKF